MRDFPVLFRVQTVLITLKGGAKVCSFRARTNKDVLREARVQPWKKDQRIRKARTLEFIQGLKKKPTDQRSEESPVQKKMDKS